MRLGYSFASLLAAAALPAVAHADTTNFVITGNNTATNTPYTISFSLDPSTVDAGYGYSFQNVSALVDSVPDTVNVLFQADQFGDRLYVQEPNYGTYFESDTYQPNNGTPFFSGDQSAGTIPTFNDGTYGGVNNISCQDVSALRTPRSLFPTAALLQVPIITTSCGEAVTLTETTPSTGPTSPTVTPEPSTLALLGTGALSAVGIVRRRFSL